MTEPGAIRFACIGCGAWNEAGAETCAGCGHPFGGPPPAGPPDLPGVPIVRRPVPTENPYAPPAPPPSGPPTFRIGTAMGIIAAIAVVLAGFASDATLGFFAAIGLVPASLWLAASTSRRAGEGRPMRGPEQALSFLQATLSSYLVVIASACGFLAAGVTTACAGGGMFVALAAGATGAVGAGWWLTRALLRAARARAEVERQDAQIWWLKAGPDHPLSAALRDGILGDDPERHSRGPDS